MRMWVPKAKQKDALEHLQAQRARQHANQHAVRALIHVPSLELRRQRTQLTYFTKVLSMDLDRLVRNIAFTPSSKKAKQVLAGKAAYTHWLDRTKSLLKSIPELKEPYAMLRRCLGRNGGVLPSGLDVTLPGQDGALWYDSSSGGPRIPKTG
jgi:hypothetical protein